MQDVARISIREVARTLRDSPTPAFLAACRLDRREGIRRLMNKYNKDLAAHQTEEKRISGLLRYERDLWEQGHLLVAGIDEAGRGPLAGPVMAAACVLPVKFDLPGLNDSKQLTANQRQQLFDRIKEQALDYAVAGAEPAEIDRLNILQATKLAMRRAVEGLRQRPHYLLIDGMQLVDVPVAQTGIIGGDALSASIAAASILAKVTRDRLMSELHTLYPVYGFGQNKGYGTKEHMLALQRCGPSPIHRLSFAPVNASTKTISKA